MAFLKILLLILKILGLSILGILALILLIIFIVLFVPVRYKGSGHYTDESETEAPIAFKARVSWLLHMISFSYEYGKDTPVSFKLFGIDLLNRQKKDKPEKREKPPKKKKEKKEKEPKKEEAQTEAAIEEPKIKESEIKEPEQIETEQQEIGSSESETTKSKNESSKKDTHKNKNYGKMNGYLDMIRSEEFKKSFSLCKDSLIKILKSVLPRRWKVDATLGFEDPATLGSVLAFNGIFYVIVHRHLFIHPCWDREVIDISGDFKGRITFGGILFVSARLLLNKDIRKIIKMVKEAQ
ncbi:MAG: hypothetical protein K6E19_02550 [Lachnospiraceae bacterium]|nr:hypothetical protein [Lachnospiraceae bacterium]